MNRSARMALFSFIGYFCLMVPKHFAPRFEDFFFWIATGCILIALQQWVVEVREGSAERKARKAAQARDNALQASGKE